MSEGGGAVPPDLLRISSNTREKHIRLHAPSGPTAPAANTKHLFFSAAGAWAAACTPPDFQDKVFSRF